MDLFKREFISSPGWSQINRMESLLVIIIVLSALLSATPFFLGWLFSAPAYKGPVTKHFDGRKFHNPGRVPVLGWEAVVKWARNRERVPWPELFGPVSTQFPPEIVMGNSIRVTFINHSTFLLQTYGLNILTDPIWSRRASPVSWAGPKRMRPPGIPLDHLPAIDIVFLSHNHYDHLDLATLKRIHKRDRPQIFCPLGVGLYLEKKGIGGSIEMDWWDEVALDGEISVVCTPAQHFSGRGMFDRNRTLWAGFGLRAPSGTVYFAGDTGYGGFFREIGKRIGPVRLALLPIGAYKPHWFMAPIHTSPEEAVKIHQELAAEKSIGTHFGTFPLADDGIDDPVHDLEIALDQYRIPPGQFITLKEGSAMSLQPGFLSTVVTNYATNQG